MAHRQYEVWHDENKQNGYYHGLLFMPTDKRNKIIAHLKTIRLKHNYPLHGNLKFAKCLNQKNKGQIISNNLSLFAHLIKSKENQKHEIFHVTPKNKYEQKYAPYLKLSELFECKFGLLKVRDNHQSMFFDSYSKKVETTFRFILKGCCHGMFNAQNPIEITKFYFDGDKHHNGGIDIGRITKGDLRDYCRIAPKLEVDSRQITERDDDSKLMINLVDNVVGGWVAVLTDEKDSNKVLFPLRDIHDRLLNDKIFTNPNSKWYKSITLSEFSLENDKIIFPNIFRNLKQTAWC